MQFKANAKINLGLFISSKRPDGYHDLESLFMPIPWYDEIEFTEADHFSFSSSGIEIPHDPKGNMIIRAYEILQANFDLPAVEIHLNKQIPIGAGLGGGSSDGAHMLKTLNTHYELGIDHEKICDYALELGSDCPFFIANQAAIASGRGEKLEQIQLPDLPNHLLIVVPPLHISTAKAYSMIRPRLPKFSIKEILNMPLSHWPEILTNDFEKALIPQFPELGEIREKLISSGASFVSMSGSGSAFYAFYDEWINWPEFPEDYRLKALDLS